MHPVLHSDLSNEDSCSLKKSYHSYCCYLDILANAVDLHTYDLLELRIAETICTYVGNSVLSFRLHYRVHASIFAIGSLITKTILYCFVMSNDSSKTRQIHSWYISALKLKTV